MKRFEARKISGYVIWDGIKRSIYKNGWEMRTYKTKSECMKEIDSLNRLIDNLEIVKNDSWDGIGRPPRKK